jgi:integrase
MAAKMQKTKTPGVYKRGGRYVIAYRVEGVQKYESLGSEPAAIRAKAARMTDIDRGEFEPKSRITFHAYAREWIGRYEGTGRHRIRASTRTEYKRQIEHYVVKCPHLPASLRLTEVTPVRVDRFGHWLREQTKPAPTKENPRRRLPLSDATVKRIMAPLQACLGSAVREGMIRSNPPPEVKLPVRQAIEEDEEQVKAMTREQLDTLLNLVPSQWQVFFRFLAQTGLRISEASGLEWRHLQLNGSHPRVKVRQALVKGDLGPPKSKYGRRDIPIDHGLVTALRAHRNAGDWPEDGHPVFAAGNGAWLRPENLFRRVLQPAREEACLPWVGFHTFRHTCAMLLFAEGRNAKQVQHWLGHHSASFTLDTYIGLLDGDIGDPLTLGSANKVQTDPTPKPTPQASALKAAA